MHCSQDFDHNCVVKVISELIVLRVEPDDVPAKIMVSFFLLIFVEAGD